ncbi:twin-arginine translocation signal domain-containing protein [Halobellus sp. Atlit-38R]|uniref:twin-arginine translocation signal domain-containing protein n=1 Tax=Halobellus sp. Atlit-38R TaxID=2282131 RepID=UPI00131457F5|nr:twin-arginine translocation signal domain-containing protein [Halobellus sp. Atlit-38R]
MADGPGGLSRRKLLYGLAATGAAAGSGSGVAAMLTDTETTKAQFTTGSFDLDVDVLSPAEWQNDSYTASLGLYQPETASFELAVDDNPAYVWLVAPCPTCTPTEEKIDVRVELADHDGSTTVLFEGSLREFRAAYGSGGALSTEALPDGDETWTVSFSWELTEVVDGDVGVDFGFEFRAVQERYLDDPMAYDLGLPECDGCDDGGDENVACGKGISFAAFCSEKSVTQSDVEFTRRTCGDTDRAATLEVTTIPSHVDHVLLKHGTKLDVFAYDGESTPFSINSGGENSDLTLVATYEQDGSEFPESGDPPRATNDPCPDKYWVKYNFEDAEWAIGTDDTNGGSE